jgi:hypothetical protein
VNNTGSAMQQCPCMVFSIYSSIVRLLSIRPGLRPRFTVAQFVRLAVGSRRVEVIFARVVRHDNSLRMHEGAIAKQLGDSAIASD